MDAVIVDDELQERDEFPCVVPPFSELRIDLPSDPDFTRKGWGRRVKSVGGHYSEARGHVSHRFVHVPASEEGVALASSLLNAFAPSEGRGEILVIVSFKSTPTWARFHDQFRFRRARVENSLTWLSDCLEKTRASYRAWWDREGRPAAARQAKLEAESRAHLRKIAPEQIAALVCTAIKERGLTVEQVQAAVARGFDRAAYVGDVPADEKVTTVLWEVKS